MEDKNDKISPKRGYWEKETKRQEEDFLVEEMEINKVEQKKNKCKRNHEGKRKRRMNLGVS